MKYLLIILLLTGCGVEPEPDEFAGYKWDGEYSHISELGFFIHFDEPIDYLYVGQMLDDLWVELQLCTNIYIDPVKLVIHYSDNLPKGYDGFIRWNHNYTYIRSKISDIDHSFHRVIRHEFIHHLLYLSDFNQFANESHHSELFSECG